MNKTPPPRGIVFVISGPGGVGKTTLIERLVQNLSFSYAAVSTTTRAPRKGEKEGEHYHFVSRAQFKASIEAQKFYEYVLFDGEYYGTAKLEVQRAVEAKKHVFLAIDTEGKRALKLPHVSIFLMPPSLKILKARLQARRTETEERISRRIQLAEKEMESRFIYDYILVNDNLDSTYQTLHNIVTSETHHTRWV